MLAPAGLDAGLLVNAENVIAWPQCCTFPTALVKIEDATSLAGELRITREDPSAMTPGPQCVLAEPAPQGGAADLCHDAARHRLVAQFGDRPVRQGQTSTRRQLTRQCLDRNDDTGGKTGRSPASRQVIKTGKSLETEAPTPLADDLARHVEAGSDALVAKPPVRQEYNLGPHNVAVWRRIVLGPDYQFGSLSLCELDQIGAFSGHDASSWPRTILPCPYESLKNTSPYLWNRVLSRLTEVWTVECDRRNRPTPHATLGFLVQPLEQPIVCQGHVRTLALSRLGPKSTTTTQRRQRFRPPPFRPPFDGSL